MTPTNIEQVAQALLAARRDQKPCDATPLAAVLRDAADAYAVQDLVTRSLATQPQGVPRFWKSGGLGADGLYPHAPLPAEGVWTGPADAGSWHFNICLIEAEIALRLGRAVTPVQAAAMTYEQGLALVDAMTVSIEVVDARWRQGTGAPPLLKLADLQAHGALVLGEWTPFVARDWAAQGCTVQIGRKPAVERRGTHPLGDPAALLPGWLRHVTRNGETVPAGTVVTTGSWCGMLPTAAGDRVLVRFEGVGEAALQL